MKITKKQLKQIIKEEIARLNEQHDEKPLGPGETWADRSPLARKLWDVSLQDAYALAKKIARAVKSDEIDPEEIDYLWEEDDPDQVILYVISAFDDNPDLMQKAHDALGIDYKMPHDNTGDTELGPGETWADHSPLGKELWDYERVGDYGAAYDLAKKIASAVKSDELDIDELEYLWEEDDPEQVVLYTLGAFDNNPALMVKAHKALGYETPRTK